MRSSRRVIAVLVIAIASGVASPASATQRRTCTTIRDVGRDCIVITTAGKNAYRVRVELLYKAPRDIGLPTLVKRSVWAANVACKARPVHIDSLHFYGADGGEVAAPADTQGNLVQGLETTVLPNIVTSLCGR